MGQNIDEFTQLYEDLLAKLKKARKKAKRWKRKYIQECMHSKSEWILCKDRLPEMLEPVLLSIPEHTLHGEVIEAYVAPGRFILNYSLSEKQQAEVLDIIADSVTTVTGVTIPSHKVIPVAWRPLPKCVEVF